MENKAMESFEDQNKVLVLDTQSSSNGFQVSIVNLLLLLCVLPLGSFG